MHRFHVRGQPPQAQPQHPRGQVRHPPGRQDHEARVVGDQMQAPELLLRNTEFSLCSLSEPIREVFWISGFDQIVAIHPSRAEAIAALDS